MASRTTHPPLVGTWAGRGPNASAKLAVSPSRYVFVLAALGMSYAAEGLVRDSINFVALNFALFVYLLLECQTERERDPRRWLINPAVAASIGTFLLGALLPNLAYFESMSSIVAFEFLGGDSRYYWLTRAMRYALIGAVAMWIGFRTAAGRYLGERLQGAAHRSRLLRHSYELRPLVIVTLIGMGLLARLVQASLGVYGYGADPDQLYAAAPYTQFLSLIAGFTKIALLAAALSYFSGVRTDVYARVLVVAAFIIEVLFGGFLAGFKGGVFLPVVTLAIAHYWFHSRIKLRFILAGTALLVIAYAVVEPFRALRWVDPSFDSRSLTSIGSTVLTAVENRDALSPEAGTGVRWLALRIVNRNNLMTYAAIAVKFKTENAVMPPDSPRFLFNLVTSPIAAFVPRLLWRSKPLQNLGFWFNVVVMNGPGFNAVAMSPFGYLYFAGGGMAVLVGFLAAGMFFRVLFELLRHQAGGVLVYLSLVPSLALVDSAFYALFAGTIQSLVFFLIVQRLVFKR